MLSFLAIPGVFPTIVAALTWVGTKIIGKRADTKAGKVASAMLEASALMGQALVIESFLTRESLIIRLKGIVAVTLAKVGVYEKDREPYQAAIDAAIAGFVSRWVQAHPMPTALPPVALRQVEMSAK